MQTYTSRRNLFGTLSNDKSSANLTVGDSLMNVFEKKISTKFNFTEASRYSSTVASQQFYELPNNFGRLNNITVTISDTKYSPKLITTRAQWDSINASGTPTSDIPEYCYIFGKQIGFYPTPSSANANSIYLQYHRIFQDITLADYTTGTITSIANGATAVVGDSTVWTAKMAGMWIKITDSSTANTGDGTWYEIESVESNTALTLKAPYQGISIAAGTAAYTIGQVSLLPEDYQILPVFEALETYFTSIKPDGGKSSYYRTKVREMKQDMMEEYGSTSLSPVCSQELKETENINNYITGS
ncbi:MAG: hypothetical protein OEV44_01040 [Spirochaetota bacterium]|nr:hypothetical protein [Spirochaetota bacterium]